MEISKTEATKEDRRAKHQLIHADAFTWLKQRRANSVHAIVTDPPFALVEYKPDQLEKRANGNGGIWPRSARRR